MPASTFAIRFWVPLFLAATCVTAQTSTSIPEGEQLILPKSGCAKAHCTGHLSDAVETIAPSAGIVVALDPMTMGANQGLGCSSNLHVVACTFDSSAPPNLVVYDGDSNRIFADNAGLLDSTAHSSAPIVFTNNKVLAVDDAHLILFNDDGSLNWISNKPDTSTPISPVLVGDDIVLLATSGGAVTTWDLYTGKPLSSLNIDDPGHCASYDTTNTPAIDDNRAYIVVNCSANASQGGLAAIDVVTGNGPLHGSMRQAWLYRFAGPSGASPLFHNGAIFFDGLLAPNSTYGVFMGVHDAGDAPVPMWSKTFTSNFAANAALDPRGGFWVFPVGVSDIYRLSGADGSILQVFTIPTPPGMTGPYRASSAISVSQTISGDAVLTFGIVSGDVNDQAGVMSVNVAANKILWQTLIDSKLTGNSTSAQFPIVKNAGNLPRVVFPGSVSGTYFIGSVN